MPRDAKNYLLDTLGRFLGLGDSVIRGALLHENYQVFLGLIFELAPSKSD